MAKNLQAKLGPTDSIRIYDINKAAADKLAGEVHAASAGAGGASVEVVQSVGDAALNAVRAIPILSACLSVYLSVLFSAISISTAHRCHTLTNVGIKNLLLLVFVGHSHHRPPRTIPCKGRLLRDPLQPEPRAQPLALLH